MSRFVSIDLGGMSPPDIIETLDYETIMLALKDDASARMSDLGLDFDVQDLESDPAIKILEVAAAREIVLRARVNGAAKALLLALAKKHDLEHLGAWFGVERQVVKPADNTTIPPTPAVMEDEERFRHRIQLAPQAFSTAGPIGAYEFHVLTAVPTVKDVGVVKISPGTINIYPLMMAGDGVPTVEDLNAIRVWLSKEAVHPLTDVVNVLRPAVRHQTVDVTLVTGEGPDFALLKSIATAAIRAYANSRHKVGRVFRLSGIIQAAQGTGAAIDGVVINEPKADVDPGLGGAVYVDNIVIRQQVIR